MSLEGHLRSRTPTTEAVVQAVFEATFARYLPNLPAIRAVAAAIDAWRVAVAMRAAAPDGSLDESVVLARVLERRFAPNERAMAVEMIRSRLATGDATREVVAAALEHFKKRAPHAAVVAEIAAAVDAVRVAPSVPPPPDLSTAQARRAHVTATIRSIYDDLYSADGDDGDADRWLAIDLNAFDRDPTDYLQMVADHFGVDRPRSYMSNSDLIDYVLERWNVPS